jgi:hypothetical protein
MELAVPGRPVHAVEAYKQRRVVGATTSHTAKHALARHTNARFWCRSRVGEPDWPAREPQAAR